MQSTESVGGRLLVVPPESLEREREGFLVLELPWSYDELEIARDINNFLDNVGQGVVEVVLPRSLGSEADIFISAIFNSWANKSGRTVRRTYDDIPVKRHKAFP